MSEPDTRQPGGEREIERLLFEIVQADSPDQLIGHTIGGLSELSTAALLYYERDTDGAYRLVHARDRAGTRQRGRAVGELGAILADHLPELVEGDGSPIADPATLHMDGAQDSSAPLPARRLGPFDEIFTTEAATIAPLRLGAELIGTVVAVWPTGTPPATVASEDRAIARVCSIAGPTLYRLKQIDYLRFRLAESETIRRLLDSVARTPDFIGSLDTICRSAKLITGLDFVAIASTTSDHVIWQTASGATDPSFVGSRIRMPNFLLKGLIRRGEEIVLTDVRNNPPVEPRFMPIHTREGIRASVTTPVYVNARLRAMMLFGSRRVREFSPQEIRTMHAIAGTVATAVASSDTRLRVGEHEWSP